MMVNGRTTLVLRASGELDFQSSDELRKMLTEAADTEAEAIAIDLARTRPAGIASRNAADICRVFIIDSGALHALIAGFNAARAKGKEFHVVNPTGLVLSVLVTTGLIHVFNGQQDR